MTARPLGALLLLLVTLGAHAHAQDEPGDAESARLEASERYDRGVEFYRERNFHAALAEFRKAHELTGNYRVLYNIGQVCFQVADYPCALTSFETYLKEGGDDVRGARVQEVSELITSLQDRVATIRILTNVTGAEVSIDHQVVGTSPMSGPVTVSAGRHEVSVLAPGYVPATQLVDVAGRERRDVALRLVALAAVPPVVEAPPPQPPPPAPQPPPAPAPRHRWTSWSWVGVGSAAALATAGSITGVLALQKSDELRDRDFVGAPGDEERSLQSSARNLAIATDVLFVASALTLTTTVVLTYSSEPRDEVAVQLGPSGAAITGAF